MARYSAKKEKQKRREYTRDSVYDELLFNRGWSILTAGWCKMQLTNEQLDSRTVQELADYIEANYRKR